MKEVKKNKRSEEEWKKWKEMKEVIWKEKMIWSEYNIEMNLISGICYRYYKKVNLIRVWRVKIVVSDNNEGDLDAYNDDNESMSDNMSWL